MVELGIFLPIANNGWILSTTSPQYMPSFDLNRYATLQAERYGFRFALSMVKWRGYGGATEFWDHALESLTLMAGLAAVTRRIELYASVQPLTVHPAIFARMAATVDDISGGRFGVNIVSGWNKDEYAQMGLWPGDQFYDERYAYAEEWLTIVKGLWATGRFSYHGRWLAVDDCLCQPRPGRMPPIVCAGMSETGLRFTVQHGDISFLAGTLATLTDLNARAKAIAAALSKPVKTCALYTIVAAESDAAARDVFDRIVAGADRAALAGIHGASGGDAHGATAAALQRLHTNPFMTPVLRGSPRRIADQVETLQRDAGIDSIICTFPDFRADLDFFGRRVVPLLRRRGLLG